MAANVDTVHKLQTVCSDLIAHTTKMNSEDRNSKEYSLDMKAAALSLLTMKTLNREVFLLLESKRKEVDVEKEIVDRLHLDMENLLYKQAYLRRQINQCKDLPTPMLDTVEKELEITLSASKYSVDLPSIHEAAVKVLSDEATQRQEMQSMLQSLAIKTQQNIDRLDKKRKFLDELPSRVSLVKAASLDLQTQFSAALQDK